MYRREVDETLNPAVIEKLKDLLKKHNMKAVAECQLSRRVRDALVLRVSNELRSPESQENRQDRQQEDPKTQHSLDVKPTGRLTSGLHKNFPLRKPFCMSGEQSSEWKFLSPSTSRFWDVGNQHVLTGANRLSQDAISWAEAADNEDILKEMEMTKLRMKVLDETLRKEQ